MSKTPSAPALPPALRDRVLARLGIARTVTRDEQGLLLVYRAWCERVPFDNVRKMIALRSAGNAPLPGGDAVDFLGHWLSDGAGGTCWPSSNALHALLASLGFAARRVTGAMGDRGLENHGSVKVRLDGSDWLVDSSMLCRVPLPLGADLFIHDDPVHRVEVEPVDGTHVVWTVMPQNAEPLPCRLIADDASHGVYLQAYEASRQRSPFNQRLYAKRNHPGETRVLVGTTRVSKTARGVDMRELPPDTVADALVEDIGLSRRLVAEWVRCGGLEASLAPPSGPAPPDVTRMPPSRR